MLFSDLCNKEVVSVTTGARLGHVDDVEIDEHTALILRLYIYGRGILGGFFSHDCDIVIEWCDIEKVGPDIILVRDETERAAPQRRRYI